MVSNLYFALERGGRVRSLKLASTIQNFLYYIKAYKLLTINHKNTQQQTLTISTPLNWHDGTIEMSRIKTRKLCQKLEIEKNTKKLYFVKNFCL